MERTRQLVERKTANVVLTEPATSKEASDKYKNISQVQTEINAPQASSQTVTKMYLITQRRI